MAAGKYQVAPDRMILGKDKAKFQPGKPISADLLGITAKDFDVLVKEGSVIKAGKAADEKPETVNPAGEGDEK